MSLIEKIDAEIEKLWKEDEGRGSNTVPIIVLGLEKAKEIILSEQKEPCEYCKYIYTIEATSYAYTEPIASLSGLSEINYCPKCGRPLNQPSATDNNVVTIGDKMRECGEKLSKFIETITNTKDTALSPEEAQELKAERDYWEREAKKWCAKLGEIRLLIGEQN